MRSLLRTLATVLVASSTAGSAAAGGVATSQDYTLAVGTPAAFELKSSNGSLAVVFEDDGETAYFYALDYSFREQPIQEAMHIYNVRNVKDRQRPSVVRMAWSSDGTKAALWINGYAHAVFDFSARRGYCRTNFPAPAKWNSNDFQWRDEALRFFQ